MDLKTGPHCITHDNLFHPFGELNRLGIAIEVVRFILHYCSMKKSSLKIPTEFMSTSPGKNFRLE